MVVVVTWGFVLLVLVALVVAITFWRVATRIERRDRRRAHYAAGDMNARHREGLNHTGG